MSDINIYHVAGDANPPVAITFKDRGDTSADPNDPDTWPAIDLSTDTLRADYYQAGNRAYSEVTLETTTYTTFTWDNHKLVDGDRIRLRTSGSLDSNFSLTTLYYVVNADQDAETFELATTEDGSAVVGAGDGTGDIFANKQFATAAGTFDSDGTDGLVNFSHPVAVYNLPGDYDMELVIIDGSGDLETAYDVIKLHVRSK